MPGVRGAVRFDTPGVHVQAGFFYQQHANGHEIVGFYADAAAMATGVRGWHDHRRGAVATLKASMPLPGATAPVITDGEAIKCEQEEEAAEEEEEWVHVGMPIE